MLSLSLALLISCASGLVTIEPFHIYATLPAIAGVQDGRHEAVKINVVTGTYEIVSAEEWALLEPRTIKIMPEDYAIVKKNTYGPCIKFKCAEDLDLISHVFENIDAGLGKIPGVK